ncbi:hypothetical protein A3F37_01050 [Candidatus Saccharibacteria bacterium RIFCSPHIGHO2_12_FULL_41_12]|nr:MAG: hypothetical protein A3F37_01050 [Candidatus Saccharibacteria bacterium RIFCSPHIGHO2_12_FULL_41_12]
MKKLNQNGATHLIILGVVVLAIIVGASYLVYTKTKKSTNNSQTTSTSTEPQQSTKPTQNSDEDAARAAASEHFTLIKNKQVSKAYEVTCSEFKQNTSQAEFDKVVATQSIYTLDLAAIKLDDVQIRNNQARLKGEIGPLSPNKSLEVDLLKSSGSWCVFGYRVK